jgi:subtilisin
LKRRVTAGALVLLAFVCSAATASAETLPGRYMVVLQDNVANPAAVAAAHADAYGAQRRNLFTGDVKAYSATIPADRVAAVRADPNVQFVSRERRYRLGPRPTSAHCVFHSPQATQQCLPQGADRIDAELSSTRSGDGRGSVNVNVAVVDSGIALDAPDLNLAGGVGCETGTPVADPAAYDDAEIHGTFDAGLVGAKDNAFGTVGVAPGTPLWSARVSGPDGEISESAALCAVEWITSTRKDRDPRNDIAVANMSLAADGPADDRQCGRTTMDVVHMAICRSVAAGVTYVVGAANDGIDFGPATIPANYGEVLTVSAMGDFDGRPGGLAQPVCFGFDDYRQFGQRDDSFAFFSNFATSLRDAVHTVSGPGECNESMARVAPGRFELFAGDGTSFSTPHVAGTVALCIARGLCRGDGIQIARQILARAAVANLLDRRYGFIGDPLHPTSGRYYGPLIRAGIY